MDAIDIASCLGTVRHNYYAQPLAQKSGGEEPMLLPRRKQESALAATLVGVLPDKTSLLLGLGVGLQGCIEGGEGGISLPWA